MTDQPLDVFALPVHPAADVFPMLGDEELLDLAADIKTNGLLNPVIIAAVNDEWLLVDGRNRREACRLAKVAPRFEIITSDPVSYIISANIHRRSLTQGQRAMAVARLLETNKTPQQKAAKGAGLSQQRISQARTVIAWAPDLVDGVMNNTVKLDAAYKTATERKKAKEWRDDGLRKLRSVAPDLADRVANELTVDEAIRSPTGT